MAILGVGLAGGFLAAGTGAALGTTAFGLLTFGGGFAISIYAYNLLNPPESTTFGPQLDELRLTTSTYGKAISRTYGTDRIAGNLIYGTDIVEVRTEQESGGKGGPQVTSVQFEYFMNIDVCFGAGDLYGAGVVEILALLGDGKFIRDWTGQGPVGSKGTIRTYDGSLDQAPDPFIVEQEGANRTPGSIGLVHAFFELYPLADHGNRIPNVEAILTRNPDSSRPVVSTTAIDGAGSHSRTFYNRENGVLVGQQGKGISAFSILGGTPVPIFEYDIVTNVDPGEDGILDVGSHHWAVTEDLGIYIRHGEFGNYSPMFFIDAPTGRVSWQDGESGPVAGTWPNSLVVDVRTNFNKLVPTSNGTVGNPRRMIALSSSFGSVNIYSLTHRFTDFKEEPFSPEAARWVCMDGDLNGWVLSGSASTTTLYKLTCYDSRDFETGAMEPPVELSSGIDISATFGTDGADLDELVVSYIESFHALLIRRHTKLALFDIETETVIKSLDNAVQASLSRVDYWEWVRGDLSDDGLIGIPGTTSGDAISLLDVDTFEYVAEYDLDEWISGISLRGGAYESRLNAFVIWDDGPDPPIARILYIGAGGQGQSLQTILEAEHTLTPLELADLAYSAASPVIIDGYTVGRVANAEANTQQLLDFSFGDIIPSEGVLEYVQRGGTAVLTVPEDDLGAHVPGEEPPERLRRTRDHEKVLPIAVNLTFKDAERDYKTNDQRFARTFEVADTREELSFSFSIVMTPDVARQWCQKALVATWLGQDTYEIFTLPKYARLEPSDLINVVENGTTFRLRINEFEFGLNYIIGIQGVRDLSDAFISLISGDSGNFNQLPGISTSAPSIAFLIDNAPLRDQDFDLNTYMGVAPIFDPGGSYRGAILNESDDGGVSYEVFTSIQNASAYGRVDGIMPDATQLDWDYQTSLRIQWIFGAAPSSVTESQALDGLNAYAIGSNEVGWEIVNVVSIVQNADNSYQLSQFLRGRIGSQNLTGTHGTGEFIVRLTESNITRRATASDRWNIARLFRADTIGHTPSVQTTSFTNTGRVVRPIQPAGARVHRTAGVASGDLRFQWRRRTGVNGNAWWNGQQSPVGDVYSTATNYDFELINPVDGSVALTRSGIAVEQLDLTETEINVVSDSIGPTRFLPDIQLTLTNSEFELGNLNNWTHTDDSPHPAPLVVSTLGGFGPQEGTWFIQASQNIIGPADEHLLFENDEVSLLDGGVTAAQIDAGEWSIRGSVWFLNVDNDMTTSSASCNVVLRFYDMVGSGKTQVGSDFIGPVRTDLPYGEWDQLGVTTIVPSGARAVAVVAQIDAFLGRTLEETGVDNAEIWLGKSTPTDPSVKIYQNSDLYGRGQALIETLRVKGMGK